MVAAMATNVARAQYMPHVYINPGHGGHDSDDRNVVIYPFAQGDTAGYWESTSNSRKALHSITVCEPKATQPACRVYQIKRPTT